MIRESLRVYPVLQALFCGIMMILAGLAAYNKNTWLTGLCWIAVIAFLYGFIRYMTKIMNFRNEQELAEPVMLQRLTHGIWFFLMYGVFIFIIAVIGTDTTRFYIILNTIGILLMGAAMLTIYWRFIPLSALKPHEFRIAFKRRIVFAMGFIAMAFCLILISALRNSSTAIPINVAVLLVDIFAIFIFLIALPELAANLGAWTLCLFYYYKQHGA